MIALLVRVVNLSFRAITRSKTLRRLFDRYSSDFVLQTSQTKVVKCINEHFGFAKYLQQEL